MWQTLNNKITFLYLCASYLYITANALISTSPTHCWKIENVKCHWNIRLSLHSYIPTSIYISLDLFFWFSHTDRQTVLYLRVLKLGQVILKVTFNKLQKRKHQDTKMEEALKCYDLSLEYIHIMFEEANKHENKYRKVKRNLCFSFK